MDASVCETRICAKTMEESKKETDREDGAGEQRDRDGETEIKVKTDGKRYAGIIMRR